jgi:hypothetical protein
MPCPGNCGVILTVIKVPNLDMDKLSWIILFWLQ